MPAGRGKAMKYIKVVAGAAVLIIAAWLAASLISLVSKPELTATEYTARDAAAAATATAIAVNTGKLVADEQRSEQQAGVIAPVATGAIIVLIVAGAAAALLLISGVALAGWQRRRPLVTVLDVPYSRRLVERGEYHPLIVEAVRGRGVAAIETARRGGTPQTYSPHITDSRKYETLPAPAADEEQASVAQYVPTFAQLLADGAIGPGRPLLLGYDEAGAAIVGNTGDLLSTIVAGLTGSGKTNTTAVLAAQAYMMGARFIVCDPHSEAEEDSLAGQLEPLAGTFVIDVASSDAQILAALQFASDVLTARLRTSQATAAQRARAQIVGGAPLLLIVDEANAVLARSSIGEAATQICEQIFSEGRKVKVYAALLGQTWIAARAGNSSALRDTAASKYVHRMPRNQARLLLPTDVAQACERMPTGKAVLARRDGTITTVTLPRITEDDVRHVAALAGANTMPMPAATAPSSRPATATASTSARYRVIEAQREDDEVDGEEGAPEGVTQPQIALLAALMVQEAKQAEKLAQVFGCKVTAGREYQAACTKLRAAEAYIARRAAIHRR